MALKINNTADSLSNIRNLGRATADVNKANERLSSGKRINRASDDPAGAAIAAQLAAGAEVSAVAARNVSDGVSIANIADGALESASDITTRLSELATQASNGTLSDTQRFSLNQEFQSLKSELDRISSTTEFNGQQLLSGSGSSFDLQVGNDGSANSQIQLRTVAVSSSSLGLGSTDISTQAGAQAALTQAKAASDVVSQTRGEIGSVVSRLDTAYNNIKSSEVNNREAEDRISSADVAQEKANQVRGLILQKGNVGLQAQANSNAANVLNLLR